MAIKGFKGFTILIIALIIMYLVLSGVLWNVEQNMHNAASTNHMDLEFESNDPPRSQPDAPIPCYLLHKTHKLTPYIIDRMKLAQQQIQESHCAYFILYWIDRPFLTSNQTLEISQLQHIFGSDTVYVVDTINTNETFPNLLSFMFSLHLDWLTPETWAWNMADIPELVWYDHHRAQIQRDEQRLSEPVWIWQMEYDVGWTGHLGEILMGTFTHSSKVTYLGYNYNGPKLMKWTHIYKRYNVPQYTDDGIYNCLIQMIRYTAYIMDKMIEQINSRQLIYCECRGIMLCRDFAADGCTIGDMQKLFRSHFSPYGFYSGTSFSMEQWFNSIAYNASERNKLFHRLKW